MDIGKIKQVPLREIWKREDSDFTVWLENNIDYLNDVLDFEVSIEEREKRVGSFSLDLYGDDGLGGKVIIDDQQLYHIGASFKDLGRQLFAFSRMDSQLEAVLEKLKRS